MRLLQATWAEVLTLSMAFRSVGLCGRIAFASDLTLDEKGARDCGVTDLYLPVSYAKIAIIIVESKTYPPRVSLTDRADDGTP